MAETDAAGGRLMVWTFSRRLVSWLGATLLLLLVIGGLFGMSRMMAYKLYPFEYRDLVVEEARRNDIHPLLIAAVIRVESKFKSGTTSRSNARGLMQIVPETGYWAAQQMGFSSFTSEMLFRPEVNIRIGTWYLHYLLDLFDGNLVAALAAYNGGLGNVSHWLEENTWDGTYEQLDAIPFEETRMFVKRVLDDYRVYRWLYGRDF